MSGSVQAGGDVRCNVITQSRYTNHEEEEKKDLDHTKKKGCRSCARLTAHPMQKGRYLASSSGLVGTNFPAK